MVHVIEYAAVVSAAVYAVGLAGRHGMDPVGTLATAMAVSFGGGTLRDLFLDRAPLFWVAHEEFVAVVFVIALVGAVVPGVMARVERFGTLPDALGMGCSPSPGRASPGPRGPGRWSARCSASSPGRSAG